MGNEVGVSEENVGDGKTVVTDSSPLTNQKQRLADSGLLSRDAELFLKLGKGRRVGACVVVHRELEGADEDEGVPFLPFWKGEGKLVIALALLEFALPFLLGFPPFGLRDGLHRRSTNLRVFS